MFFKCLECCVFLECRVMHVTLQETRVRQPNTWGATCLYTIPEKLGHFVKGNTIKKRVPKFPQINVNVFSKYEHILILMAVTHSNKVGTEAK